MLSNWLKVSTFLVWPTYGKIVVLTDSRSWVKARPVKIVQTRATFGYNFVALLVELARLRRFQHHQKGQKFVDQHFFCCLLGRIWVKEKCFVTKTRRERS